MIHSIVIENYQSLGKVKIRLGKFTVITGPTGSGKSGLIRAVKLAVFNQRGTSFIRHGEKACMVQLGLIEPEEKDGWAVAIRRGKGRDCYMLAPPGDGGTQTSTKLAGGVPEEVTRLLRLSPLNFAGQFDSPFLLTDSAGEVARRLGELTNVTLVFDAAREANRRRLAIAGDLRHAEEQLAALGKQATQYRSLKAQREALAAAEEAWQQARATETRIALLKQAMAACAKAGGEAVIAETRLRLNPPPDLAEILAAAQKRARLIAIIAALDASGAEARLHAAQAQASGKEETGAHEAVHRALIDAGACPTCGQEVSPLGQLAVRLYGDRA